MGLPKNSGIDLHSKWPSGEKNLITDVPGVKVGQVTLHDDKKFIHTGVTAILPHEGNIFKEKVMGGVAVLNGFGKSTGIIQLQELGTIETPIIMTNTFSVGTAYTALVKNAMKDNPDIGTTTGTVSPLVTECNDGCLSDIRGMHVTEGHVFEALANVADTFEEGAVGGGSGMACLGLKGGIGSASRVAEFDGKKYTVASIVMSNFGAAGRLAVGGRHLDTSKASNKKEDKGSIIMIIATDIPLSERQLTRVAKRSAYALGRVGSYGGNDSGDIAFAFTTANKVSHYSDKDILEMQYFYDEQLDKVFEMTVEAVEEAIISSLYHARTVEGIRGEKYMGFQEFIERFGWED